jgi:hypothetical protein
LDGYFGAVMFDYKPVQLADIAYVWGEQKQYAREIIKK